MMGLTPSLKIWAGKKKNPGMKNPRVIFYDDNDVDENSLGLVPIGPPHFRVLSIFTILSILNILNDLSNSNIFNFNDLNNLNNL